jgi:Zn-finger nucleic acid-binding protein
MTLQCPKCGSALKAAVRHKVDVQECVSCHGMWIAPQAFAQLENQDFALDEHAKGTLVFSSTPTSAKCPECARPLQRFNYRLYDLELEYCDAQHGFWLDAGEDTRVLELMKKTQANIDRDMTAEDRWASALKHLHSPTFLAKVRDLLR